MNRRSLPHAFGAAALALAIFAQAEPARCEASAADKAAAESLFSGAKQLMDAGRFEEACPKLADSQRLDPGIGTLLNLGMCYKNLGRTASAWATFKEAASSARVAGQTEREDVARQEAAALEPTLSHLTIAVAPETAALPVKVLLDGSPMPKGTWGVASPVDPGKHTVEASAPGRKTWRGEVTVAGQAQSQRVDVPTLAVAPAGAPASSGADAAPTKQPNKTLRIVGYSAAGVGLAAIGVGAYFGVQALSDKSESDEQCDGGQCSPEGLDDYQSAQTNGVVADVCFGVGIVGIAVGTVLVLTNGGLPFVKKADAPRSALRLGGSANPKGGGLSLRASF